MNRIFITGDTHGDINWGKLNTRSFPEQKELTKEDYLIIAGDFGAVWTGDKSDRYFIKSYEQRNFTTLFVDGNHENHDAIDAYPVTEWNGGKVHMISDTVIHLMRGQVYEIAGRTFFTMGGAQSTDKMYRKEGVSWWARELPSDEEYDDAIKNLSRCGFKVDYIITHSAPEDYAYDHDIDVARNLNKLTKFLSSLITEHDIKYKDWYFGHYHRDRDYGKLHCVYRRIIEI